VSHIRSSRSTGDSTNYSNRYAPFQYTKEGQDVMERLWGETIKELGPLGVSDILKSL
jgi:hypothetical protein